MMSDAFKKMKLYEDALIKLTGICTNLFTTQMNYISTVSSLEQNIAISTKTSKQIIEAIKELEQQFNSKKVWTLNTPVNEN